MSAVAVAWARIVIDKSGPALQPSDCRALKALARAHSATKGHAPRSYKALCRDTNDSRRTVIRAISRLVLLGLIQKPEQRTGRYEVNSYSLNLTVFRAVEGCHGDTSEGCQNLTTGRGATVTPLEAPRGATVTPPNARAHAAKGPDSENGIPLEELEEKAWPASLKIVGGRNA